MGQNQKKNVRVECELLIMSRKLARIAFWSFSLDDFMVESCNKVADD